MEKSKWAALGERLKLGGERLRTGGAEMGRKVTGKMKEMLQPQSQESKWVDEATLETMEGPNWGLNMRICGHLNSQDFNGSEVMKAIKKKISGNNAVSQGLSLDLLEACAMNCEKVFSEVASEKVLDEMVKMIDNPHTHHTNRQRALELIQAWGESEDLQYLPVFHQTFMSLRNRKAPTPKSDNNNSRSVFSPIAEILSPPEGYPYTNTEHFLGYHDTSLSVEEKREVLTVTRNSMEILAQLLSSENSEKIIKDDLTLSLLEKCKESQPVIQRILESVGDDEALLFEALSLHEELVQVLSKYTGVESAIPTEEEVAAHGGSAAVAASVVERREEQERKSPPARASKVVVPTTSNEDSIVDRKELI